ncbi:unnamed protein product [Brassica rapa subsp. trilocularis]
MLFFIYSYTTYIDLLDGTPMFSVYFYNIYLHAVSNFRFLMYSMQHICTIVVSSI